MEKNKIKLALHLFLAIFLTLGLSVSFQSLLASWSDPTQNPTGCNAGEPGCDAPLNTGPLAQTKGGPLYLNNDGLAASGLIVVNGNVGIGTTNPQNNLHISGSNYPTLKIESIDAKGGDLQLKSSAGSWQMYVEGADLRFWDTDDRLVIKTGGNVGVGLINPGEKLEVNGSIKLTGDATVNRIKNVADPTDAHDVATMGWVEALASSGGTSMVSAESSSGLTFTNAAEYCWNLSAPAEYSMDGNTSTVYNDWHLPSWEELAIFSGLTSSTSFLWTTKLEGSIYYFILRLSDGRSDSSSLPIGSSSFVRCVR